MVNSTLSLDPSYMVHCPFVHLLVFILAILTTLSLQILSNLCNELGDTLKGTDADQHGRKAYGLQSGALTIRQMKTMIWTFVALSVLFGTALILVAFLPSILNSQFSILNSQFSTLVVFFLLGALAIFGAVTYTLGKYSYGYYGLGDLSVFIFFGLLSTVGAFFLQTQDLTFEVFALGSAIGLPCVGVLNLNNLRDMDNDLAHGKHTFASILGPRGARVYQTALLTLCLVLFCLFGHFWTLCILPVWIWHLWYVWTHTERLDIQMPVLMFSTLIVAICGIF